MPNWCSNKVTIKGPAEAVTRLLEKVEQPYELKNTVGFVQAEDGTWQLGRETVTRTGKVLLWNMVHPDESEMESYADEGWYDWNIGHWGTKWEINVTELNRAEDETGSTVTFYFDSAWSPPVPAFAELADQYPEVGITLEYAEPGMDFGGTCAWENGEQTEDTADIPEEFMFYWYGSDEEE